MAATNVEIVLGGAYAPSNEAQPAKIITGEGAPADADVICTDTEKYPIGSLYIKTDATSALYYRHAAAGVAADYKAVSQA